MIVADFLAWHLFHGIRLAKEKKTSALLRCREWDRKNAVKSAFIHRLDKDMECVSAVNNHCFDIYWIVWNDLYAIYIFRSCSVFFSIHRILPFWKLWFHISNAQAFEFVFFLLSFCPVSMVFHIVLRSTYVCYAITVHWATMCFSFLFRSPIIRRNACTQIAFSS